MPNQEGYDGQLIQGPRRLEYDGYTYFGVEDGNKVEEEEDDDMQDAGATGGYIEDNNGQ